MPGSAHPPHQRLERQSYCIVEFEGVRVTGGAAVCSTRGVCVSVGRTAVGAAVGTGWSVAVDAGIVGKCVAVGVKVNVGGGVKVTARYVAVAVGV